MSRQLQALRQRDKRPYVAVTTPRLQAYFMH